MSEEKPERPSIEELITTLIIQEMRNYDVLIHLLAHFNKEAADQIYDLHEGFGIYGPMPFVEE